ncbi:MAG: N-acetylmuramoyl-L-alanine amidase [Sphingobacteriales bacterium JAD_PAG50586_3]|nr:MAG: N-acetylmuramoyl-L-alanine amidase [Sphingobacteriales bacterium JAD_PAG50586_3]
MKGNILGIQRKALLFSVPLLIAAIFLYWGGKSSSKETMPRSKPAASKIKTIVIDPGHGGHDSGCLGSSAQEKHVALSISLKLGKMIEDNFPDVKVIYTRKTDVFVELYRRAQIANDAKADLFICIHCNSGPKAAFGAETYVMGLHKTEGNLGVAKRENSSILMEDSYDKKYEGYDPNSSEADIIFSLFQSAYLDRSLQFAAKVQDQFRTFAKRYDRKVRQAGFLVLWKTSMPSVLIETGFLTNDNEHDYLASKKGQQIMAASIYRAFIDYKSEVDGFKYADGLKTDTIAGYQPKDNKVKVVVEPVKVIDVDTADEEVVKPVKVVTPPANVTKPVVKDTVKAQAVKVDKPIVVVDPPVNDYGVEDNSGIIYRVQFYTSPAKVPFKSPTFAGLDKIFEYKMDGIYKYTAGRFTKYADALKYQSVVRTKNFKDAFVIVLKDNKRIIGNDAKQYFK